MMGPVIACLNQWNLLAGTVPAAVTAANQVRFDIQRTREASA